MKGFLAALALGGLLCVPAAWLGQALDFGGFAWLLTLICIGLIASLADREGFYGPGDS